MHILFKFVVMDAKHYDILMTSIPDQDPFVKEKGNVCSLVINSWFKIFFAKTMNRKYWFTNSELKMYNVCTLILCHSKWCNFRDVLLLYLWGSAKNYLGQIDWLACQIYPYASLTYIGITVSVNLIKSRSVSLLHCISEQQKL